MTRTEKRPAWRPGAEASYSKSTNVPVFRPSTPPAQARPRRRKTALHEAGGAAFHVRFITRFRDLDVELLAFVARWLRAAAEGDIAPSCLTCSDAWWPWRGLPVMDIALVLPADKNQPSHMALLPLCLFCADRRDRQERIDDALRRVWLDADDEPLDGTEGSQ